MAKIRIIYETVGGNTELVCEKVRDVLSGAGHEVEMKKAKLCNGGDLGGVDLLVLASPTYEHGELEPYMGKFIGSVSGIDLGGLKCAVISLGDAKYEMDYFFESEKILSEFIAGHGGEIVCDPLKIAMTPVPRLDNMIADWAGKLGGVIM